MNKHKPELIVALDVDTFQEAKTLIDSLGTLVNIFKVGSQIFTACGPEIVVYLLKQDKKVFLDLKYHDIPNTVANAVSVAVGLGQTDQDSPADAVKDLRPGKSIFMCTVHTVGGQEMLRAAVEKAKQQAEKLKVRRPLMIGITVLTSDEKKDNITHLILERARLAKESGLDGVVCSSQEAEIIRQQFGADFVIVTPGLRPTGSAKGDQKRVSTPAEAIAHGSDYLVVGRPIIQAPNPIKVTQEILEEIEKALSNCR